MPQPALLGPPYVAKFGGLALPDGQGTLTNIDLNDKLHWIIQDWGMDYSQQLTLGQIVYRAESVYLSADFPAAMVRMPMAYRDDGPTPVLVGDALAKLMAAGEQLLTFDNVTAILARFSRVSNRARLKPSSPYWWTFDLEFACREPWFKDIAVTTFAPVAVSGSVTPGTSTAVNIVYAGTVFAKPVFTLTIPVGNTVVINSVVLKNTMTTEALTVTFPGGLLANTAYSIVIDCDLLTVTGGTVQYDFSGSFPRLVPQFGAANNPFTCVIVTASGTTTSCTLGATYKNRWAI